jgi:hypothetical protein
VTDEESRALDAVRDRVLENLPRSPETVRKLAELERNQQRTMTVADLKLAARQYAQSESKRWSFTEGQYQELIMFLDWLDARLNNTDTYKASPGGW